MSEFDLLQFQDKFLVDAKKLLLELEKDLLEFESTPSNKNLIESIFRAMHTLKGVGSMYGFENISNYTHRLENIYEAIRDDLIEMNQELFTLSFSAVDHLRNLLTDIDFTDKKNIETQNGHIKRFDEIINAHGSQISDITEPKDKKHNENNIGTWYILVRNSESFIKRNINFINIFKDLSKLGKFEIIKKTCEIKNSSKREEYWEVFLESNANFNKVEDIFVFILDDCKIVKLSGKSIFEIKSQEDYLFDFDEIDFDELNQVTILEEIENLLKIKEQKKLLPKIKSPKPKKIKNRKSQSNTISVSTDKLDSLMNLVSELVTANSKLTSATELQDFLRISQASEKIDELSRLFRDNALNIRLVPVKEMLIQFKRLIRDLSISLGKKVNFVIEGENTELDKNIIEVIKEPIMHIIRNSMDHGIQTPEIRLESGKKETGKITFSAYQSGNNIFIKISDDGLGINPKQLLKKAKEQNFIDKNAKLTEKEAYNLIFMPGFSTAKSLTEVSGRGVGMDVVHRKIDEIRGKIEIESKLGKGTSFIIKLHQTISIIDTLLLKVENTHYTIPIDEVDVCIMANNKTLTKRSDNRIKFRKKLIPYINLRQKFELEGTTSNHSKFIIIGKHKKHYALLVDKILGEHQAVIKSIDKMLNKDDFLSGGSILGNGELAFMLNTEKLINTEK